ATPSLLPAALHDALPISSPALTICASIFLLKKRPAPAKGCLITTISTFIANIFFTVSIKVSPLLTEEEEAEKLIVSADSLFSASSKESLVRVEFSKNIFAIVMSLKEGTFLIGLFTISLIF